MSSRFDAVANSTEYLANSTQGGVGQDEVIPAFTPQVYGLHVALIMRRSGNESYTFTYDFTSPPGIPAFGFWDVGPAILLLLVTYSCIKSRNKNQMKMKPRNADASK